MLASNQLRFWGMRCIRNHKDVSDLNTPTKASLCCESSDHSLCFKHPSQCQNRPASADASEMHTHTHTLVRDRKWPSCFKSSSPYIFVSILVPYFPFFTLSQIDLYFTSSLQWSHDSWCIMILIIHLWYLMISNVMIQDFTRFYYTVALLLVLFGRRPGDLVQLVVDDRKHCSSILLHLTYAHRSHMQPHAATILH